MPSSCDPLFREFVGGSEGESEFVFEFVFEGGRRGRLRGTRGCGYNSSESRHPVCDGTD
jgi:hypothetical protein